MELDAFLFVAVADASLRWEQDPHAFNEALVQLDRLLERVAELRQGRLVERRGDGALAILPAVHALDAALGLQAAVQEHDWSPFSVLPVRLGLQRAQGPADRAAAAEAEALARLLRGGGILLGEPLLGRSALPRGIHTASVGHFSLLAGAPSVGVVQVFVEGRQRPVLDLSASPPLAVPPRRPLHPEQKPAAAEASALLRQAEHRLDQGDEAEAATIAYQARQIWTTLQDPAGEAQALILECRSALRQARLRVGMDLAQQALERAEAAAHPDCILGALGVLCEALFSRGQTRAARSHCVRALQLARRRQASWALAQFSLQMAGLAEQESSYREASHYLLAAESESRRLAPGGLLGFQVLAQRIQVALQLGHYALAQTLLERALDPREWAALPEALAWPRNLQAVLHLHRGEYAEARALCEAGLAELGLDQGPGSWYAENLSVALFAQGQTAQAMDKALLALHAAEHWGRMRGVAWCNHRLGAQELAAGRFVEARERLARARELHAQLGESFGVASDDLLMAHLERLHGDPAKAAALAEQCVAAFIRYSTPREVACAQVELAACFLARGEHGLALEPVTLALRQSAVIGAWPVFLRALRRLAEIRVREGRLEDATRVLWCVNEHPAAEAELKGVCRGLLKTLGAAERSPAAPLAPLEAARLLGVPLAGL